MKAFQFTGSASGLQLRKLPIPKPGKGHALIKVKAAGLCHSDTHVIEGGGAAWMCTLPVVLGHEMAGTITEIDSDCASLTLGDRVAVACVGHPIEERSFSEALGVGCDGGYAEYAVAPIKNLVKLLDAVSFAQAAVATDSIATSYHAVVAGGRVTATLRAEVYGVDINPAKFEPARAAGAQALATNIKDFPDKAFDVVINFAGAQQTVEGAMSATRVGVTVVVVGLAAPQITLTMSEFVTKYISVKGSTSASIDELRNVLDMIAAGDLKPHIEEVSFEDIPLRLARLGSSELSRCS
ncbi:NAD-dependent alcohol dehydrogenase [Verticillium alfalfae VaMs.102]|uniref:NAD-dependent alcohol dehydrogenase n=1 Tax=Verticillium alfalfae (strain VaMs.102 / ATCC MYA-4576 / FGSC 10136) TaxID=526221 RepID=C9SNC9_VERA1|nr:NAD-dependent alcohol dehydrogenase [Verticillium alfalfae VaMs.102]EEY20294.1 NAD-dependent alcohol dehydrogenase [Verticillium alfalfae VaMs.102]